MAKLSLKCVCLHTANWNTTQCLGWNTEKFAYKQRFILPQECNRSSSSSWARNLSWQSLQHIKVKSNMICHIKLATEVWWLQTAIVAQTISGEEANLVETKSPLRGELADFAKLSQHYGWEKTIITEGAKREEDRVGSGTHWGGTRLSGERSDLLVSASLSCFHLTSLSHYGQCNWKESVRVWGPSFQGKLQARGRLRIIIP